MPVAAPGAAEAAEVSEASGASAAGRRVPTLGRAVAVYTLIRVGLIVVLTALLELAGKPFGMPLILALAFAIVLQLPLAVLLFRRQRTDLTAALARAKSRRTSERDRLRSELTGQEPQD